MEGQGSTLGSATRQRCELEQYSSPLGDVFVIDKVGIMLTLISQKAVSMKLMKQFSREGSLGGIDTGICMSESLCCPPETMNIANQLYSGIK